MTSLQKNNELITLPDIPQNPNITTLPPQPTSLNIDSKEITEQYIRELQFTPLSSKPFTIQTPNDISIKFY